VRRSGRSKRARRIVTAWMAGSSPAMTGGEERSRRRFSRRHRRA
jgi:hypothetical protein